MHLKQLMEAFRSAKKSELAIIAAAACVLLFFGINTLIPQHSCATEKENRIQYVLSQIEGAGTVDIVISMNDDGIPCGAVVAASGADRIQVRLAIQQAVHTLTGLDLERIEVIKSKR